MPAPPDPARFDTGFAHATAEICDAAAARLAEVRRGQAAEAASATNGWLGPHRDRFDRDLDRALRHAAHLEVRLRRLADDLRERARA